MIISVINHTNGDIRDEDLQEAIRAINLQIERDFEPYWSLSATLRLEGKSSRKPHKFHPLDMRGDAIIYIWNKSNVSEALGFHNRNFKGIPFGFVFTEICNDLNEPWTVSLSHEALETIGDPEANLMVMGPHPDVTEKGRFVFHCYEMCDAVQNESYTIQGIDVSNFVLPLYFTSAEEFDGRNDFLGTKYPKIKGKKSEVLKSFGVNPGGYVWYYDPSADIKMNVFHVPNDPIAEQRLKIKDSAGETRRSARYRESLKLTKK